MKNTYIKIDSNIVDVVTSVPDTTKRIDKRTLLFLKQDKVNKIKLYQRNIDSAQIELDKINVCLEELKKNNIVERVKK